MNYKEYYENQAGGNYPVFRGSVHQQGYGLGGIFKKFFNFILPVFKTHALPVLKSGAQSFGTEAIKTAANIATDAIAGRDIKEASKEHANTAIQNLSNKAQVALQSGSGKRKKKVTFKKQKVKTRRIKDIFD